MMRHLLAGLCIGIFSGLMIAAPIIYMTLQIDAEVDALHLELRGAIEDLK